MRGMRDGKDNANPDRNRVVTAWRLPLLSWLPLLLPALLAFAALLPLLQAGYVADDWAILALVRHGAMPLEYYFADHTATYSYRPNGMLAWYLVAAAFGDAALPQYVVQIAIHALNAALLALLLLRLGCTRWTALLIGSVFALHPAAVATAAWLADRFDLLAVNGCLLLLLAVHAWIRRGSASAVCAIALAAAWAIGAKETAIVALPVALAWILLGRRPHRLIPMLAATLPFIAALGLRWWTFGGSGLDKVAGEPLQPLQLVFGIGYWLWRLPETLLRMPPLAMTTLLGGAILLLLILCSARQCQRALAHRHTSRGLNACLLSFAGVALLLLPALPQAPIAALVLGGGEPLAFAVNHRFYYLALIGLGLCLAPVLDRLAEIGWRRSLVVATALLAIAWLVGDWRHATHLRQSSANPGRMQLVEAIADAARAHATKPACLIYLDDLPPGNSDVQAYIDLVAKSQLDRESEAMSCIVLGNTRSTFALVADTAESAPLVARIPLRQLDGARLAPRPVMNGRLRVIFPDAISPGQIDDLPHSCLLRWNGHAFDPNCAHAAPAAATQRPGGLNAGF